MASEKYQFIIPKISPVHHKLSALADEARVVIISGLPGVGKSLYINEFYHLVKQKGREISLIQWDQARKAFESDEIFKEFPLVDGQVHNAVKLMAGAWIMDVMKDWITKNKENESVLLIEAPLVGHRFLELVVESDNKDLEKFLSSDKTRVVMPIPTVEIRTAIEAAREAQVKDDAKVWFGAKPSVVKILWKMTCEIAHLLGMDIELSEEPAYDPEVYSYVFQKVLKHRNFEPLIIDEIFKVGEQSESSLHSLESLVASAEEANNYAKSVKANYPSDSEINDIVDNWYNT